ncbi:MAG: acetyl-coenzyme A synthetase, partial [Acidobacteria bacterium]
MSSLDLTEAQIAVHWKEEEYFYPSEQFKKQANLNDPSINQRFTLDKFPQCFNEYAELLAWYKKWDQTLDSSNPPFWKWFVGGKINASFNCLDRHLATHKGKAAYIFVPEPENEPPLILTYLELYNR